MARLTLIVGRAGLESYAVDAARIIRSGKLPLIVLLVERKGRSVAWLITTVEMLPSQAFVCGSARLTRDLLAALTRRLWGDHVELWIWTRCALPPSPSRDRLETTHAGRSQDVANVPWWPAAASARHGDAVSGRD